MILQKIFYKNIINTQVTITFMFIFKQIVRTYIQTTMHLVSTRRDDLASNEYPMCVDTTN